MFIKELFTIAKIWKQPTCPTTAEMEFYSAIRKNNTMWFEDKWMQLEGIMLSEVSQVQKDKGTCFLLYVENRSKRSTYTQKQT
jgi:hypothetical protein